MLIPVLFTAAVSEIYKFINGDSRAGAWIKSKLRKMIPSGKSKISFEKEQPENNFVSNETKNDDIGLFANFDLESFIKVSESDSEDFGLDYTMPGQAKAVSGKQDKSEDAETKKKDSDKERTDEINNKADEESASFSEKNMSDKSEPLFESDTKDEVSKDSNIEALSSGDESFEIGNDIIESIFSVGNDKDKQ